MTLYTDFVSNPTRTAIGNFLQTEIYITNLISLDYWSFVHLFSGMILMLIIIAFGVKGKRRYFWLVGLLVGYEIIEFFLYQRLTTLFIAENITNVIWDVLVGIIGGVLFLMFTKK